MEQVSFFTRMIDGWVRFFAPQQPITRKNSLYKKTKGLFLYTTLCLLITYSYGLWNLYSGNPRTLTFLWMGFGSLFFAANFIFKWTGRYEIAAYFYILNGILCINACSYFTGGFVSPFLFWIVAPPFVIALLVGVRSSLFMFFLGALSVIGFFTLYKFEFELPQLLSPSQLMELKIETLFGMILLFALITTHFLSRIAIEFRQKDKIQNLLVRSEKLASIGKLSAGIGHEINNPLAAISAYTQALEARVKQEKYNQTELLEKVDKLKTATSKIDKILKGLRHHTNRGTQKLASIEASSLLRESVDFITDIEPNSNVEIEFKTEATDHSIYCYPDRFQQVILNLMTNAKHAVRNVEQPKITIKTYNSDKRLIIKFIDNGQGIEAKEIGKVFNAFYTTKDPEEGTGLGLYIVNALLAEINGEIQVNSTKGIGTEFSIQVPLAKFIDASLLDGKNL